MRRSPRRCPAPLMAVVGLAAAACTLLDPPPPPDHLLPDRAIAPWTIEPLEVCLGDDCDPAVAAKVCGAALLRAGDRWQAVAELDGALHAGVLEPGWRLQLEPEPLLIPDAPWHAGGLRDPTWLAHPDGDLLLFGVADESAIGVADVRTNGALARELPLWTAAALGHSSLTAPTAAGKDREVMVAMAADHTTLLLARGASLALLGTPAAVLTLTQISGTGWRQPARLDDPELTVREDDTLGLFFAAHASGPPLDESPPVHASIGHAGSNDGRQWESFSGNPVHDVTVSFLFHGQETQPSVARSDELAVMLYRVDLGEGGRLGLAVHRF